MTPKTLTEPESLKLLENLSAPRDRLLILLMLDAGLRVGELVQLRKSDLWSADSPAHTLYVRPEIAKGGRSRFLPLSERIPKAIQGRNIKGFFSHPPFSNGFVFPGIKNGQHMTSRQVERIIKRAGIRSIGRPVNPHMLRHTFASRLMRIANARVVQELLGHKKLTSTQIYTHPNSDDLTTAIDSLNKKP